MNISSSQAAQTALQLQRLKSQSTLAASLASTSAGKTQANVNSSLIDRLQATKNLKQVKKVTMQSTLATFGQNVDALKKRIPRASLKEAKAVSQELGKMATQLKSISQSVLGTTGKAGSASASSANQSTQDSAASRELRSTLMTLANKLKQAIGQLKAKPVSSPASVRDALANADKVLDDVIKNTALASASATSPKSTVTGYEASGTTKAGSVIDASA